MKTLQTLYKKTSTGADQFWTIGVREAQTTLGAPWGIIVTRWGQVGGKEQVTEDVIKTGKSVGKKNETSPLQQAELEAQAKWEKQLKKGYVKDLEHAREGKVDEVIEGGVVPMLAHRFDEQGHKISYPAFVQPKFDGHRCIAVIKNGEATLWSRTRKPITGLPHLIEALNEWAHFEEITNIVLDGELYNHDYKDRFEELSSFIRTPEAKPGHEVLQYHIYDLAEPKLEQLHRIQELKNFAGRNPRKDSLVFVMTVKVDNEGDMMLAFENFLARGYEGLMVRNAEALYVNKRSYDLQKVKEFMDSEFKIIDIEEGRGKLAGHAIFVCKTSDAPMAERFRVKLKGETSQLKTYFENPGSVIGKMLTVKYQGITNKTGVPRFPVGVRIREDV